MLIDLGRNEVRRVSAAGSVSLTETMVIECYSHVMHIVSNVTGHARGGMSAVDALRAALPVGTLSGSPKERAMEIIDELEPVKRGIYGGAIGYLSCSGSMDTAIATRTEVVKDGQAFCRQVRVLSRTKCPLQSGKRRSANHGRRCAPSQCAPGD